MSKTLSWAFVTRAGCHVCAAVRKHPKLCHTPSPCVRANACLCLRACLCVQASWGGGAALRVAGLADCCIIFGRVAPSLWRASLKSAGSLPLPLLRLRESGQARLWGLAGGSSGTERCRTRGPYTAQAPRALHYAQMAGLPIGAGHHWCSASGSVRPFSLDTRS